MKAVVCRAFGPPSGLTLEEVPAPEPGPGQVLIRVDACAVNFPDTLIIQGRYQTRPPLPFSPGGEVAGVVAGLGVGAAGPPPGTRVLAMIGHGGFAEMAVADADAVVAVPEDVDAVAAAALSYAYGTTLHALRDRAVLRPGETALVLGAAGGAGLAAVQIAKLMGARVIAAASTGKLDTCRDAGADAVVDYRQDGWRDRVRELAGSAGGVDVVYDPVGGAFSEPALRVLNWGGRHLVVGFAAGEIPRVPLNLALLKGCAILGVFYGGFAKRDPEANRALVGQLFAWMREGRLRPRVSATYGLEDAPAALDALLSRSAVGKIVLVTEPPAAAR
ncbi:MAG: NADPH:quinone oxidoreductase family protein [Acetobacteraceae bacterium]|nr:NADPH:quinone oxidoreductase family protein [Acetobacteraceae bacterium]